MLMEWRYLGRQRRLLWVCFSDVPSFSSRLEIV